MGNIVLFDKRRNDHHQQAAGYSCESLQGSLSENVSLVPFPSLQICFKE